MAPYLAFARAALQRQLAYRTANWAGLFTNMFFLLFRAFALRACFEHRDHIGSLDVWDAVTYATVSQSLLMVCPQWGTLGLGASVRSGHIAVDLLRPVDFVGMMLSRRLAVSAYYGGARMVPVLALGWLGGFLVLPTGVDVWAPFVVSTALAAWIAATLLFLVDASAFWLESERGVRYLVLGAAVLPSGLLLPLDFFPEWVRWVFACLPFPHTLYSPTSVWLGTVQGFDLATLLLTQLAWAVGLTALCRVVLRLGSQRLQIVGG